MKQSSKRDGLELAQNNKKYRGYTVFSFYFNETPIEFMALKDVEAILDMRNILECPRYDNWGGKDCNKKSKMVATGKSDVFRCPSHGLFEIDEDGNLVD